MNNAKLLFTSSRPLSWVNTAFPFAAGYLYFMQSVDWLFIIGTLFFLIPYNLLMYGINDVYDYESDMRNPRKGGVEGAIVPKKFHSFILRWAYLLPLPFVIAMGLLSSWQSIAVLAGCLFFVIAYSAKGFRFKEIPALDSISSSLHFVGPLLYALSIASWPPSALPIAAAFFLWGLGSHSLGAIQDIASDKAAGISSIATALGARPTLYFSLASYLMATLLVAGQGVYGSLIAIVSVGYIANVLPFVRVTNATAESTRAAWRRFLWINYVVGAVITMTLIASWLGA